MRRYLPLTVLCVLFTVAAQAAPDPMEILAKATTLHKGIRDYTATVAVDTDIPGVDMPHREAKVYVKPPDKTYIESNGLVAIPKRALLFGDIAKEVKDDAKVVLAGTKTVGGQPLHCLKIVPKKPVAPEDQPRVMLWINGSRWTVEKVHILRGPDLIAGVTFAYRKVQGFWMPTKVSCTIPKGVAGSEKPGHMSLSFSGYKINTGLTDEFFEKRNRSSSHGRPRSR